MKAFETVSVSGHESFKAETGTPSSHAVAVISIPKSGTYLTAKLLSELGCIDTEIHAHSVGFDDYRGKSLREKRELYSQYNIRLPLGETLSHVRPGQFLVGHFSHNVETVSALQDFKKIFCFRNLRDVLISHMRFMQIPGRGGAAPWRDMPDGPDKMLRYCASIGNNLAASIHAVIPWHCEPSVFKVCFETLMGDRGSQEVDRCIQELIVFLGQDMEAPSDFIALKTQVFDTDTLTYSGTRSRLDPFWDERVEEWFNTSGLAACNELIGYK